MLKDELMKALEIFDSYNIPEERQRQIVTDGVHFDFTYGDSDPNHRNKYFNVFDFANFLNICTLMGFEIDANAILEDSCNTEYEDLLKAAETFQKFSKKLKKDK